MATEGGSETEGREAARRTHLAETDWLAANLENANLRVVDMRGYVRTQTDEAGVQTAQYAGAAEEYAQAHLPGALYLDWTRDIVDETDPVAAQLAGPEKMARVLGQAGIGDQHEIVAYDAHPASQFATRFWWALRCYGHTRVRVLNGGWAKWTREARPVTSERPAFPPAVWTPRPQPEWRATAEEVLTFLARPGVTLIDARDTEQFTGRIRRGPRGGHIPGALSLPREVFFNADGTFRAPDELQALADAQAVKPDSQIVAYCNGGVAATSILFTLSMLGYPHLTNYDGSWNEWTERADLPAEQ